MLYGLTKYSLCDSFISCSFSEDKAKKSKRGRMMEEKKKLATDVKITHYVNWITYSYMKQPGLGEFLAQVSDCSKNSVGLLETSNDTSYSTSVELSDVEDGSDYMDNEDEEMTANINNGDVDCCQIHEVLCWLLRRGHIEPGCYVVEVMW